MKLIELPNSTTIDPEKITEIRKFEGLSMRFEIDAGGETFVVTERNLQPMTTEDINESLKEVLSHLKRAAQYCAKSAAQAARDRFDPRPRARRR